MPGPETAGRVAIVRHGSTDWSAAGRFTGSADIPLNAAGRAQAAATARTLTADPSFAGRIRLITSPLARAAETAAIIAGVLGAGLAVEDGLREEDLGAWQGLTREEAARRFPGSYARWAAGDIGPLDGREGLQAVAARAVPALLRYLGGPPAPKIRPADRTRSAARPDAAPGRAPAVVAVTHGNTALALIGTLLGLPAGQWADLPFLPPGGVRVLDWPAW